MGAVLATRGAAWGLAAGIVLCIIVNIFHKPAYDTYLFPEEESVPMKAAEEMKEGHGSC